MITNIFKSNLVALAKYSGILIQFLRGDQDMLHEDFKGDLQVRGDPNFRKRLRGEKRPRGDSNFKGDLKTP